MGCSQSCLTAPGRLLHQGCVAQGSYRSGSVWSTAERLLWSRIRRVLTKPPRFNLLGWNKDAADAALDIVAGSLQMEDLKRKVFKVEASPAELAKSPD